MSKKLKTKVIGNKTGPVLVFIHGWPDDSSLWADQINYFKKQYYCVLITLPGFSPSDEGDSQLDFPEIIELITTKIKSFKDPVYLIGHDWGAYIAYQIESRHPELVQKIVGLDVGGYLAPQSIMDAVSIAGYQLWLTSAWLMRNVLPKTADNMSKLFASLIKAPGNGNINSNMNYPYFYFWRDMLIPKYQNHLLKDYKPHCPVLFLYGKSKPFMFHSKKWEQMLSRRADCEVHAISDAGHWLMRDRPEVVNEMIKKWVEPTEPISLQH